MTRSQSPLYEARVTRLIPVREKGQIDGAWMRGLYFVVWGLFCKVEYHYAPPLLPRVREHSLLAIQKIESLIAFYEI